MALPRFDLPASESSTQTSSEISIKLDAMADMIVNHAPQEIVQALSIAAAEIARCADALHMERATTARLTAELARLKGMKA